LLQKGAQSPVQQIFSTLISFVFAAEVAAALPSESKEAPSVPVSVPVGIRDYGRSQLRDLADGIDRLFGTERDDENKSTSTIRLIAKSRWNEGSPNTSEFDARFSLKPATLRRWERSIQDWFNDRLVSFKKQINPVQSTGQLSQESNGPDVDVIEKKDPWRFTVEHKVKVALKNQYDGQAILSRDFEFSAFLHHFETNLGYSIENLWDAQTRINSNLRLNPKLLFQFSNSASWLISRKTFTTGHGPSLTYMLTPKQAFSLSLSLGASVVDQVWAAQVYMVATSYRLQAYGDWIFLSINPYLSYPRANRFYRNPGVTANLEMVF
jgi:hypothetical protein